MPLTTTASNALSLTQVGTLTLPGSEISAFDAATKTLWVTSATGLRVLDFSNPASPTVTQTITFADVAASSHRTPGASNDVNSVTIKNGIVAVAVNGATATNNGKVFLFDTAGTLLKTIDVGAVPDNLVFTPDGSKILVANEGESNLDSTTPLTTNPVGSISIIDISTGAATATVQTAGFEAYNSQAASLIASGVRLFTSVPVFSTAGTTVAQDLEPEYIAISPDGTKALVTLQEANSVAIVDIATATVTGIVPLGLKDFSTLALDPSDRDNAAGNSTAINFQTGRPVFGLYQPDAIASFSTGGQTYYIIANEGDDRNDFLAPNETTTVGNTGYVLDPTAFPNAATLKGNGPNGIGSLVVSNLTGLRGDTDGDGDIDQIISYGGRSFSILDSNGNRVFDSGSHIDATIAAISPVNFDDGRSDAKGAEPEGVTTAVIGGKVYAFVGLERFAGTMVYDVTNPTDPSFVTFTSSPSAFSAGATNGSGFGAGNTAFQRPEGGIFISAAESPTGKALYVVSNEGTGGSSQASIVTYEVAEAGNTAPTITSNLGGATASINVAENSTAVTTVSATDSVGTNLVYSIAGGSDAGKFAINTTTGALSFVASPNFEAPTDAGTNNTYDVIVRASDGTLSDDQAIAVTVTDVNEPVELRDSNNVVLGRFVTIQAAVDAAVDGQTIIIDAGTYTENVNFNKAVTVLGAQAGVAGTNAARGVATGTGETTLIGRHDITESNGAVVLNGLRFLNTAATTGGGPSDPTLQITTGTGHQVTNSVFYSAVVGGANGVDDRAISVPVIGSGQISVTNTYITGASAGAFSTASWGRGLWFDGGGVDLSVSGNRFEFTRTAINLDMTGDSEATITGNSFVTAGTGVSLGIDQVGAVFTGNDFTATGTEFNFRNLAGAITFDAATAVTSFSGDFINVLGGNGADTLSGTGFADVLDGNNLSATNSDNDTLNGRGGNDVLIGRGGNDTLDGGADTDTAVFSGAQSNYTVTRTGANASVVDNRGGSPDGTDSLVSVENLAFSNGTVTVALSSYNAGPVISSDGGGDSAAIDRTENGTSVTTVAASDANADAITYSINGGSDADKFDIDASTGVVTFKVAPNFEAPIDSDGNNTYSLFVMAADQFGGSDQQLVTVTVTNQNEAPVITSNLGGATAAINFAENGTGAVTTVQAADPDAGANVVYSLSGTDADFFNINATTGALTFKNAPNFEVRADNGGNNVYDVVVTASDGTLTDTQALAITVTNVDETYTLQLLHLSDGEAGLLAPTTAPLLAALFDRFEDQIGNSITIAGGDTFIPGPFLAGGTDPSLAPVLNAVTGSTFGTGALPPIGAVDTAIHNIIGVEVSGIGNHEWDLGSNVYSASITPGSGWVGANYASLTANLNFNPGGGIPADAINGRFTNTTALAGLEQASSLKGRVAPSAVITEGGQTIGFVGVTTQVLEAISSPTGAEVSGFPFGPGPNGEVDNMALLAAQLQPVIDDLRAQGVNKIVLLSHLQLLSNEKALAPLLKGVDVILAAGSNTRLGDANDTAVAFPGHAANFADTYPLVLSDADGKTTLIVNTDNEYTYLGRLVVDFNEAGEIITSSLAANTAINGAYAATVDNVAAAYGVNAADVYTSAAFAAGSKGAQVKTLTDAVSNVIQVKDGNVFGFSDVYLEGDRTAVRTEESNLGNVTADANADALRDALGLGSSDFVISIKNGGGIRAQIGSVQNNPNGTITKVGPGSVSQLDVENSLRFDNALMVFDTTAQGLKAILEHSVSQTAPGATPGRFAQIGGISFSFDPTKAVGSRVSDIAIINEDNQVIATLYDNGVLQAGVPAVIKAVTLNFLANGGDSYPIKANGENFRYLLSDGTLGPVLDEALNFESARPTNALGEIRALQEYFGERYATPGTAFNQADTPVSLDTRIQNTSVRATDTVLVRDYLLADVAANYAENGTSTAHQGLSTGLSGSISYTLTGADAALFNVSSTGAVTFKAAPNFEAPADAGTNNVYDVRVVASNGSNTTEQDVAITVTNVNDAPVISSNGGGATAAITFAENSTAVVATVAASDQDAGQTPTYSVSGTDAGFFDINQTTGVLTFKTAPNFEVRADNGGNNVYDVVVIASDGTATDTQALAITVTNVNEAPVITSNGGSPAGAVDMFENGTAVTTVVASDVDANTTLTYALSGTDAGFFNINQATGALTFKAAPNFEVRADAGGNNVYDVVVTASDGTLSDTQNLAITVRNVNETPVITSNGGGNTATIRLDEKAATVTTVVVTDPDVPTTLTYSLSGADADLFVINAATGVLTFKTQPNVDTPGDVGADNVYDVAVTASDGALSDTQALSIAVRRIINGTAGNDTLVVTGTAGPDDLFGFAGNDVMNGLAGSDILDGGTGRDTMIGGLGNDTYFVDNVFDVVTEAAGGGTDTVLASIASFKLEGAVENLTFTGTGDASGLGNELDNVITGNAGKDDLRGLAGNDTMFGLASNDRLSGGDGNDHLDGGAGADNLIGGMGNDMFVVDNTRDKAVERNGEGTDTVAASVTFRLGSGIEFLTLTGPDAINGTGNALDNGITGNAANNVLNGGAGDDTLAGGLGDDTLIGGRGADKFVFDSLPGLGNIDVVRDFSGLDLDKVQLSKADFAALGSLGALTQGAFLASATAVSGQDGDDRVIYNTVTGALYYDADGLGAGAAVQIATFGTTVRPALAFTDFEIIA